MTKEPAPLHSSLKRRILLPVALAVAVLLGSFVLTMHAVLEGIARDEFHRDAQVVADFWQSHVSERSAALSAFAAGLAGKPEILQALSRGDRAALSAQVDGIFASFRQANSISQLTFLDRNGAVIYRAHRPSRGAAERISVNETQALETSSGAFDFNDGELSLLAVFPWQVDRGSRGFVVAGLSVAALLREVDDLFGSRNALLLARGAITRSPAAPAHGIAGVEQIVTAGPPLPLSVTEALGNGAAALAHKAVLSDVGSDVYLHLSPVERDGTAIGYLLSVSNVDASLRAIGHVSILLALTAVAAVVIALTVLYRVTRRTEQVLGAHYQELAESHRRIEQAQREWIDSFDAIREPIFLHDADCRLVRANRAYAERAGKPFRDIIGRHYWEVFPLGDGPLASCDRHKDVQEKHSNEEVLRLPDGAVFVSRSFPITDERGDYRYSVHIMEDVTERERLMVMLQRENRARRTVSHSNEALVRAVDEGDLLNKICKVITDTGGYRLAWVGFKEDGFDKRIRPVAVSGAPMEAIARLEPTWGEEQGQFVSARAIRTGREVVLHDVQQTGDAAVRARAGMFGCNAAIAFPLHHGQFTFGVLTICSVEPYAFNDDEVRLLGELASDLAFGIVTLRSRADRDRAEAERVVVERKLESSLAKTVQAMAAALEARDPYTAGHQRRVADLAVAIAREMELPGDCVESLRIAGSVHDLGKIYVPAEILSKPGLLAPVEYELVKTHAQVGHDILKDIDFPWPIATMVLQHHERLDGSGYPMGLKSDAILPESRILAVADVVEAMASHRPYRPALSMEEAMREIESHAGVAYDCAVVSACQRLVRERGFRFAF